MPGAKALAEGQADEIIFLLLVPLRNLHGCSVKGFFRYCNNALSIGIADALHSILETRLGHPTKCDPDQESSY